MVDGLCRFQSDSGESFTLDNGPDLSLRDDILAVSVSVTAPGVAEVRGLTNAGINSRWGTARRAKDDPACWRGSDFEVCAR